MTDAVTIAVDGQVPDETRALIEALPGWFGIPQANDAYVEAARRLETWTARDPDGTVVGVVLLESHFPETTEVHLMAVHPSRHRQRIGTRLLDAIEEQQRTRGVRLLEVKTLGPSRPDAEYDRTRAFYRARGFLPVQETDLWGEDDPCLVMIKPL